MTKQEQIDKLKGMSGSSREERPTYDVPEYKLHGTGGYFKKEYKDEEGEWQKDKIDNDTVDIVVLKVRRKLLKYIKAESKTLWSTEYNNNTDKTQLYEFKPTDDTSRLIDDGTTPALRERHTLSGATNYILYGIVDGEVARLSVKGAGLETWFNYTSELDNGGQLLFTVETKVGFEKVEDGSIEYYRLTFEMGDTLDDFDEVEKKMKEVVAETDKIDEFVQAKIAEGGDVEKKAKDTDSEFDEFEGDETDYPEDENITPEDVPF